MAGEPSRSIQQTQCFKYRGFGHVSVQYPSKAKILIIESHPDGDQDDLDEILHDPEGDAWEDDFNVDQAATLGCALSMHPSSIDDVDKITRHLSVVRCACLNPRKMTTGVKL